MFGDEVQQQSNAKNIEYPECLDGATVFENPDYHTALIGYSEDFRAVYDYDLMVEYLMTEYGWSETEAIEWIEFNSIRALPYVENAPIVMTRLREDELPKERKNGDISG